MFSIVILCLFFLSLLGKAVADVFWIKFLGASNAAFVNLHDFKLLPDDKRFFVSDVDNSRVVIFNVRSLMLMGQFSVDHHDGTHFVYFD